MRAGCLVICTAAGKRGAMDLKPLKETRGAHWKSVFICMRWYILALPVLLENACHAALPTYKMPNYKIKDNTAPQETAAAESTVSPSAQEDTHPEEKHKFNFKKKHMQINSEVLSSQYGINVFLAGLFLMFASSLNIAWITKKDILCYLITLMLLQILWMLWYMFITKKEHNPKKEKDSHAGARWLRCGIALFAGISLFLDALKLGYFIGFSECLHGSEGMLPVTHTVHTLLQVFFLWFHSKDIIQSFKTLERFGLIHSVFTNLLLWASEVFTESKHQLVEHMDRLTTLGFENITLENSTPPCNCSTSVCPIFARAIYYLYPFNIEYHILASAMLYVLWKNIGSSAKHHKEKKKCNFHGIENGSSFGLLVFIITVAVIVIYFLYIGSSKNNSEMALSVYYFYGIIVLSAMCLASGTGLILYKSENRALVEVKSHAIKLDEDLLVGSACGSWIMSWGSILAVIYADSHPVYTWYNLPYSIMIIIQKYVQNLFIIECIHRTEQRTSDGDAETVGSVATIPCESPLFPDPPFELFFNDTFTADTEAFPQDDIPKVPLEEAKSAIEMKIKKNEAASPPVYHQPSNSEKPKKVTMKRKVLRNITVFLFLCNISLWIPPAFGCRPQYDNGLEETVFGFRPWIILIDIALPFSIFYRMHSVYSLFDVYRNI